MTTTELNPAYKNASVAAPEPASVAPWPSTAAGDWPSYNKTLTSERYSELSQINTTNVGRLKALCTYDTKQYSGFESGLIMVNGALIGTTELDIFSLDPASCAENWRTHEDYPGSLLAVNRGAAHTDGLLFRGTQDGRVLAYDFKTGRRLRETTIADPKKGESVPAAPIAWNGLVFIGNAGSDFKGGKGRMYALDAKTGAVANHWSMNTDTMGVYGNYYLKRAIVAQLGLGANSPEDAIYPFNLGDEAGRPLDGGSKYTITFEKSATPPVDAFWSITLYDPQGFPVANSLNRFAVSSWMPFKYDADGSLTLYFQNESPGKDNETNWLPAPKGPFNLTMRLYAPKSAALTGKWNPPPVTLGRDLPGVVAQ
jgi:hypothetical protein